MPYILLMRVSLNSTPALHIYGFIPRQTRILTCKISYSYGLHNGKGFLICWANFVIHSQRA